MKLEMIDTDEIKKWIHDLENYDYKNMARNLRIHYPELSKSSIQRRVQKNRDIICGKILAYNIILGKIQFRKTHHKPDFLDKQKKSSIGG